MSGAPCRRAAAVVVAAVIVIAASGCGSPTPPDTAPVPLAELRLGGETWRLEGRRAEGQLCASLLADDGIDGPVAERCGLVRTPLRHLDPVTTTIAGRLVLFSPLPPAARRVRLDGPEDLIDVVPARTAPGFPGRFFLVDLDPDDDPVTARIFADGGRPVIP